MMHGDWLFSFLSACQPQQPSSVQPQQPVQLSKEQFLEHLQGLLTGQASGEAMLVYPAPVHASLSGKVLFGRAFVHFQRDYDSQRRPVLLFFDTYCWQWGACFSLACPHVWVKHAEQLARSTGESVSYLLRRPGDVAAVSALLQETAEGAGLTDADYHWLSEQFVVYP